jgi:ABC-2 type transport system ATP-binding protein
MSEAYELCDRVAIIDRGRLIAAGTPASLRAAAGAERVAISTADDAAAAAELERRFGIRPDRTERGLEFPVASGDAFLPRLVGFPVELRALVLKKPTLEDAFIALTGRAIREEEAGAADVLRRSARARGRMSR